MGEATRHEAMQQALNLIAYLVAPFPSIFPHWKIVQQKSHAYYNNSSIAIESCLQSWACCLYDEAGMSKPSIVMLAPQNVHCDLGSTPVLHPDIMTACHSEIGFIPIGSFRHGGSGRPFYYYHVPYRADKSGFYSSVQPGPVEDMDSSCRHRSKLSACFDMPARYFH